VLNECRPVLLFRVGPVYKLYFKSGGWVRFGLTTGLYVALAGYPTVSLTIEPDRSWHPSIVSFGNNEAKGTKKI
jgi:hypothetical protein